MAQEFSINSSTIENKINQLLPSQGGSGAGIDFSASTMIIPIVDLTESAEGSGLREDLQSSLSLDSITAHSVTNTTSTIISTTGYFRVFGNGSVISGSSGIFSGFFFLDDTTTQKTLFKISSVASVSANIVNNIAYDFIVFLKAGDLLKATCTASCNFIGNSRQIADLQGNLVNPI